MATAPSTTSGVRKSGTDAATAGVANNQANPNQPAAQPAANAAAQPANNAKQGGEYAADLVEDRMKGLLSQDNAYMQMNKAQAAQQANSRGLLNTSIAAGAGQAAAIQGALPIASQDAGALQNLKLAKIDSETRKAVAGMGAGATVQAAGIRAQGALDLAEAQAGYDIKSALQQQGFDLEKMEADFSYKDSLADKEIAAAQGRLEFQADADMTKAFGDNLTDIQQQHTQSRAAILSSDMSYGVKKEALDAESENYVDDIRVISSFYDQPVDIELFPDAGVYEAPATTQG